MSLVSVYTPKNKTSDVVLLDVLEAKGIPTNVHCRDGYCGCCRTKLVSGVVEYIADKIGYTREGEILPCICKAKTDLVLEI